MGKTLIIGAGNLIMGDDGVGIHAIQRLQARYTLPDTVEVVDGGTLGMNLLAYLEGVDHLVIIDAMDTGATPGTITRLADDRVPTYFSLKISPHQVAIPDMLMAAKLVDLYPAQVTILGIQPEVTDLALELSPSVAAQVEQLVEMVIEEIELEPVS